MHSIATPVGAFSFCKGAWRRGHWESSPYVLDGVFSPEDQARGSYEATYLDEQCKPVPEAEQAHTLGFPVYRKAGTPSDWCLLESPRPRWVDPRRLREVVSSL